MTRRPRKVKWGHVSKINYRTVVGSEAWHAAHPSSKIKKLSAFRYLHKLGQGHDRVRSHARSIRRNPSSAMTTKEMLRAAILWRGY